MKNKILLHLAIIFIAASLFVSCEKEQFTDYEKNQNVQNDLVVNNDSLIQLSDIEFSNGMLIFESIEKYDYFMKNSVQITKEEIVNWQKGIGFVSQQQILEQALQEEEKFFEQFDASTMTEKEIKKVVIQKEEMGYTDFTKKHIASGTIKPYIYEDINSLELSVVSWVDANFLNLDGMVMIGNIIYQFTPTQCKQITDGNFSKLNLLKNSNDDNFEENIIIGNLENNKADSHEYLVPLITEDDGHYRIITGIKLRIWDYGTHRQFYYYIQYFNYREKWFFGWDWKEDTKADTDINGSLVMIIGGLKSQTYFLNYHADNRWDDNVSIGGIVNITSTATVTYSNVAFTIKRDNVPSINLTHPNVTR